MVRPSGTTSGARTRSRCPTTRRRARRWIRRYNGPAKSEDWGTAPAVSQDGRTVFVTGASEGLTSGLDYATIAYDASTGARRWLRRYSGPTQNGKDDVPAAICLSPAAGLLFVTGSGSGRTSSSDYATYDGSALFPPSTSGVKTVVVFRRH